MLIDFLCCAYQRDTILIVQTQSLEQLYDLWPDNRVGAWVLEWFTGIEQIHWYCEEDPSIKEQISLETYFISFQHHPRNTTLHWANQN